MQTLLDCRALVIAILVSGFAAAPSFADRVSGTLTRTYMIVEDTDLIGDITCDVANNTPCFSFGPEDHTRARILAMTRRQLVTGLVAIAWAPAIAAAQKEQKKPELATVTLIIDGMT
jgi:hypothetical protein